MNTLLIFFYTTSVEVQSSLLNQIKNYKSWAYVLENAYFIKTSLTPQQVRDQLKLTVTESGSIFVIDVSKSGWASYQLPPTLTAWMKENI